MALQPENVTNILQNPSEYVIGFLILVIFVLVTFSVTKSNRKNAQR